MNNVDDAKRLFTRETSLSNDVKRRDSDPSLGAPSLLARTTSLAAYPTVPACYYVCQPLQLLGPEVEGARGVVTPANATFFALNLGTAVPPPGTQVLTTWVSSRWVFRFDG